MRNRDLIGDGPGVRRNGDPVCIGVHQWRLDHRMLPAGNYSAVVRGANNAEENALVEVYNIQ